MTIDDKNIIWLDLFNFLTYQKKVKILDIFEKHKDIKKTFLSNPKIHEILTETEINKISNMLSDVTLDKKIDEFNNNGIEMITIHDNRYPYILREISSPPLCLYCKGNVQLLNTYCIGVVGSRKPTDYGIVTTKQYVKELVEAGVTIVSGMALGIDTIAHKTALDEQGKTIAVLGGGLYHIYPVSNFALSKELSQDNLIISENTPDTPPLSFYFPIRNRIIAGLSRALIVTEAGEKSGTLNTAKFAGDFNREVFAIPGKINSPLSKGTNKLIKNLEATITLLPEDVLNSLNLKKEKNNKNPTRQLDIKEQFVINYIQTEKKTFQEIADYTELTARELNTILLNLEMEGLIIKLANNSYIMS